mgnify:CR=1 FL=1
MEEVSSRENDDDDYVTVNNDINNGEYNDGNPKNEMLDAIEGIERGDNEIENNNNNKNRFSELYDSVPKVKMPGNESYKLYLLEALCVTMAAKTGKFDRLPPSTLIAFVFF